MKLSTQKIKEHLLTLLPDLDGKTLKRISKSKNEEKQVVRVFSSNIVFFFSNFKSRRY